MMTRLPVAVVIPVFNPEPGLLPLCRDLLALFTHVIVVNDGSTEDCSRFDDLPRDVVLLTHSVNRGKGRAMKTAVGYLVREAVDVRAVVFADGDGQHRSADVRAVAERVLATDAITFGVREITRKGAPFRSWWGNRWTALEVRFLYGLRVADTQTGLRGFPARLFAEFMTIPGERFEFEARVFRFLSERGECLQQVPIRTIYIRGNRASHFRPFRDTILTQGAIWGVMG